VQDEKTRRRQPAPDGTPWCKIYSHADLFTLASGVPKTMHQRKLAYTFGHLANKKGIMLPLWEFVRRRMDEWR
jgi:hypothetical protein